MSTALPRDESLEKRNIQDAEAVVHEKHSDTGSDAAGLAILSEFTKEEERKIIHRVDRRLVLTVGVMYCISLMDRTNLSAAAIAGMIQELRLFVNNRYSIVTLVFFTTYIVFQFPATIVIKAVGPRGFLSFITFTWGLILIGMGLVKNWEGLAALRVVLGLLEAGFFPGSVYLLSTWYVRFEVQKRYAVFYMIGSLASALAGILAFGLMQMNGIQGKAGWRWIFLIEGVISCVIGIGGYFLLVNFPDDAHKNWNFLTERETKFILARVNADRGDAVTEAFSMGKFLKPALDIKIWGFAWIFGMTTTVSYALAYFLPIILKDGMKFSPGAAQCLVAPPYAAAAILMFACAWAADKYRIRGPIIIANAVLTIIGLVVTGWTSNLGGRYFGIFLAAMGSNTNIPTVLTFQANNIRGHWKRAFCSATIVGFGGIGGIIGSLVFRSQDAPAYIPGLWACIASQVIVIIITLALDTYFFFANKKIAAGTKIVDGLEGFTYTY